MDENVTLAGLTYLYDIYIVEICKRRNLDWEGFKKLDGKYQILEKITEFRELFNDWSLEDGMKYIEDILKEGDDQI